MAKARARRKTGARKKTAIKKKTGAKRPSRQRADRESSGLDARVARLVEEHLGLQSRHGFGPASVHRDRAEAHIRWERDELQITATFYGTDRAENLEFGLSPSDRNHAFGLRQAMRAIDPELHDRFYRSRCALDDEGLVEWVEAHARFFETHAATLLGSTEEIFERVRAAEPLGEQCVQLVQMCREVLRLEADHGFEPPRAIHWRHDCEISFRRGSLRVVVKLEDHEKQGVTAEPFTMPELYLHRDGAEPISLTETIARLDPAHARRRPVADRYAVALTAVRPWLEHDAAFLREHPELLR